MGQKETGQKIGVFGGTFNPIHNAHLRIAEAAREQFGLTEVLFLPSGVSYMKDAREIAGRKDRLRMTQLAVEGHASFSVSALEVEKEGPSYTFETLKDLQEQYPDSRLYFIIGADQLFGIEHWRNPAGIFARAALLVADRGGYARDQMEAKAEELRERFKAEIHAYHLEPSALSSTEIRRRIRSGETTEGMIPPAVAAYIREKDLYR
ncbi:MAG: nicotinate-nucleotide adenylyltransferase [Lachnospiraceae bacterium]|nr:nicotinate-nucleotide adenylyltransferase [Lachnospiraceae bacterium]